MTTMQTPGGSAAQLVTLRDPRSAAAEAYQVLRTNIQFSSLDRSLRTLLVTSTAPDEGKSTTLANLAVTLAQGEQRVILIDCDLRRPSLHTLFGLSNDNGLTSMILGDHSAPPLQETGIPDLQLLSSGPLPPRPADILGSRRMSAIIERLLEQADILLFDTPPVGAVADAAVLASQVDGVLLVVEAGKTRRDRAREAKRLLEKVNANLLGVVLNNAAVEKGRYEYY